MRGQDKPHLLSDHLDFIIGNLPADYGTRFMLGFRAFEEHLGNSWENEQSKPFCSKHRHNYNGIDVQTNQIHLL